MPASIALSGLSWSLPDGTALFTGLDLTFGPERTGIVGRNGTGKTTLLRLIAGHLRPASGTVRVSGSVAMMRQQLPTAADATLSDLFGTTAALALLDKADRGVASAAELAGADWGLPMRMEAALLRCGLAVAPQRRLSTLSGGQRSRANLAAMIFAEPDFLLMDEPTNDLDEDGRAALTDLVRRWAGGMIVVSHDRALLREMDAIVELSSLGAARYGGNFDAFRHQKDLDLNAAAHDLAHLEKARDTAARRARQVVERKARKDSAGRKARARGGQPKILMDAAKARAEASGGAGVRLREAREAAMETALAAARDRMEVLQPLRMDLAPTGLAPGKTVLRLDNVTGGPDPGQPVIRGLSLSLVGPERVLIAGPNGAGKTTLLRLATGQIAPQQGRVDCMVPFALLDQNARLLDPGQSLHANFTRLNPAADTRSAHGALARFGFRAADALRRAGDLSGGERVRAALACVLGGTPPPMLLILDEPTNHLDLDGIEALEAALTAYDGAVLAVSHDATFCDVLAPGRIVRLGD